MYKGNYLLNSSVINKIFWLISSTTNIFILLICRKKKWLIDVRCISWRGYFSEYSLLTALITTLARNGNTSVTLRKKRIRYGWHQENHNCLDKHPRQNFIVHFIFFVKIQVKHDHSVMYKKNMSRWDKKKQWHTGEQSAQDVIWHTML